MELLRQAESLDMIITPVGGGGLLTGTTLTCKALAPGIDVMGAEPEAVDDAYRSLTSGVLQPGPVDPVTLAPVNQPIASRRILSTALAWLDIDPGEAFPDDEPIPEVSG